MGVWWEAAGGAGNSYKFCKEFAADGGNVFLLLNWAHDKLWLGWCSFFSLWLSGVVPPVKVNDPFSLGLPASGATWPKDQGLCPRCPGVESWREDSSSGPGEFKTGNFHEIFIFYEKKKKKESGNKYLLLQTSLLHRKSLLWNTFKYILEKTLIMCKMESK